MTSLWAIMNTFNRSFSVIADAMDQDYVSPELLDSIARAVAKELERTQTTYVEDFNPYKPGSPSQ